MPFIPHTPESLLPRSDSKNPNNTCRGITSNGTPCRRGLATTPQSSPSASPSPKGTPSAEAFCWQHKEQASAYASASPSPSPKGHRSTTIKERTSVDTLVDRLGILEVEQRKHKRKHHRKPSPGSGSEGHSRRTGSPPDHLKPHPKPRSTLSLLCCIGGPPDNNSRRAPRPAPNNHGEQKTSSMPTQVHSKRPEMTHRPAINRDPPSRTQEFLSLIPKNATPQVTALLLAELAKPISEQDTEGFIYMFWLTSEDMPAEAPAETASHLLAPPSRPTPGHRRTSDVINTFASTVPTTPGSPSTTPPATKKTMLLKIGRAQNVQRRLNQWTRQCDYNLSLIRYYPYNPTLPETDTNKAPKTPRKVPCVNKVERLIHIELNSMNVKGKGKCGSCGREHKEWFEVEASRDGVKSVDEVIRRWADWAERNSGR